MTSRWGRPAPGGPETQAVGLPVSGCCPGSMAWGHPIMWGGGQSHPAPSPGLRRSTPSQSASNLPLGLHFRIQQEGALHLVPRKGPPPPVGRF